MCGSGREYSGGSMPSPMPVLSLVILACAIRCGERQSRSCPTSPKGLKAEHRGCSSNSWGEQRGLPASYEHNSTSPSTADTSILTSSVLRCMRWRLAANKSPALCVTWRDPNVRRVKEDLSRTKSNPKRLSKNSFLLWPVSNRASSGTYFLTLSNLAPCTLYIAPLQTSSCKELR